MHQDCKTVLSRPAIFLDRDGTLNLDTGYLYQSSAWRWLPGAVEALAMFASHGYALVVITNQSGIARGYYDVADVHALHMWVNEQLAVKGVGIEAFYHCPHHPTFSGPCVCRKPSAHLILQAAKELHLDVTRSHMIGDKISDVEAGLAAGCASYLIAKHDEPALPQGGLRVPSLLHAARRICKCK